MVYLFNTVDLATAKAQVYFIIHSLFQDHIDSLLIPILDSFQLVLFIYKIMTGYVTYRMTFENSVDESEQTSYTPIRVDLLQPTEMENDCIVDQVNLKDFPNKWCISCGNVLDSIEECCNKKIIICPEPKPYEINALVTHGDCQDGTGAAWCLHWFRKEGGLAEDDILYVPFHRGDDENRLITSLAGKNVAITDISFGSATIQKIKQICASFILLDHHASANTELCLEPNCYFNMNMSGATMMWDYMFHSEPPLLIKYIEDRDLWNFELPNSKEISYYLYHYCRNDFYEFDRFMEDNSLFDQAVVVAGPKIEFMDELIRPEAKYAARRMIFGLPAICSNSSLPPSELGHEMLRVHVDCKIAIVCR